MQRLGPQEKALAALLVAAVLALLYVSVTRRPTRLAQPGSQSAGAEGQGGSGGGGGGAGRAAALIETELYTVSRRNLSLRYDGVPLHVSLLAAEPLDHIAPKVPSVLLLHAQEYDADAWEKIGTLQLIAELGHRAYAVDLPGAGSTRINGRMPHADFLRAVFDGLNLDRPLLVAASTAGRFAFDFALEDLDTIGDRLSGFIALSPTGAADWRHEDLQALQKVYTVLIYGGFDDAVGAEAASRIRRVHTAKVVQVPSAGHLHFMERPDVLHEAVMEALKHLED